MNRIVLAIVLLAALPVCATPIVSSSVGGTPLLGAVYVNFDNLNLGDIGGTSDGVQVSFTEDGQVVVGTTGQYAAPYLSNDNGSLFGDPTNGPDLTEYLTTGIGSTILTFPAVENYFGVLWGSVDTYNTLCLYNGQEDVGCITGNDVDPTANGDQGINGTYYVNITSDLGFTNVVLSSAQYALEVDNVAYRANVPEPSSLLLLIGGFLAYGSALWLQRHRNDNVQGA